MVTLIANYYVPKVEINEFNVLIDQKSFFDLLLKKWRRSLPNVMGISNNNDYKTGNLLDFGYFKKLRY